MIYQKRKCPKSKPEMFSVDLPCYVWMEDYHDGPALQKLLRSFGIRVKVKEVCCEGRLYKFLVKVS